MIRGNNQAYLTGQAAMIINVGSVYYALSTNPDNADLYENTGYALIPAGPGGRYVTGIANNLAIFKDAKNPEMAKKLIAYLLDYDFQKEWMEVSGYQVIPVYPSLASDPYWDTEAGKVFTQTPEYFEYLGYPGPLTPAAGEVWNLRLGTNGLEQMLVENKSLDEAMQSMTDGINDTISKFE